MRQATNWDKYGSNPNSFFSRVFFLNLVTRAYAGLLKNIEFNRPVDILEFGCGTGYLSRWLAGRYKVNKATLIDSNEKMLDIAKQTLSDVSCEKEFVNKDFFKFKTNGKYDIVHSQGVIEHFEEQKRRQLLSEHFKATKTGGFKALEIH